MEYKTNDNKYNGQVAQDLYVLKCLNYKKMVNF